MRTKIETHLSPEQLHEFCRRVAQTKGGTKLATIQAIAEEFGVTISLMAASSFRDGPLASFLDELKAKRELAEQVAEVAKSGAGLSDAAASVLSQKVFDAAMQLELEEVGSERGNNISLAVSRLRSGDRNAKRLEAELKIRDEQLAKLQRERTDWEEKRQQVAAQLDRVKSATPATADEVRAAAVAEIDRIMGLTK